MSSLKDIEIFKISLQENGLSVTNQRLDVFRYLLNSDRPLQPAEIYAGIKDKLNLSSVYRSLTSLESVGAIKAVPSGFKTKYEVSEMFKPHHHHTHCDNCGKSSEIEGKEIEDVIERVSKQSGFIPKAHIFEVRGLCSDCSGLSK